MKKILNLTQHTATPAQLEAGVVEPTNKAEISALLTFDTLQSVSEASGRARRLAYIVEENGCDSAMIGGAPFFMGILADTLNYYKVSPLFAFSVRRNIEETLPDGSVKKSSVFEHGGFIKSLCYREGFYPVIGVETLE